MNEAGELLTWDETPLENLPEGRLIVMPEAAGPRAQMKLDPVLLQPFGDRIGQGLVIQGQDPVGHFDDGHLGAGTFAITQDGEMYLDTQGSFKVVFDNLIHKGQMPITIGVFVNPDRKSVV